MPTVRRTRTPVVGCAPAVRSAAPVLALILAVALAPWQAAAQSDPEEQLSRARAELASIDARLEDADEHEQEAERALEDAEATLAEIEAIVNEVTVEVERQRAAVRDAERRLEEVEEDAAALQETFEERIARLYMQGPELTFELLLASEGAEEAVARTVMLEQLTEGDRVDLERLEAARVVVASERARYDAEQAQLEAQLEEQELVRAEAEELRQERALAAADARARSERLLEEHDDLEAEEQQLEALLAERERERDREREREVATAAAEPSAPAGARAASGYRWPMCAPVTSEYGPRWGRMHRGVDQGAASGSAIGAVAAGRVVFAGWQSGYGNLTLIDHGGTVSAYAHQSRIAVGQGTQVAAGQTIGYVGSTGNSTGPHLHLEFRVNGSAVNPRQYLSGSPC